MLSYLYRYAPLRPAIRRLVLRLFGPEMLNRALRRIFARYHNISVGLHSHGCFDADRIAPGTTIGRYCSFGPGSMVLGDRNHPIGAVTTHPYWYKTESSSPSGWTQIGSDVWLGANALILPGCRKIGHGAVIGAGAVVTHDVAPYAIVGGNPARLIRYRFDAETIAELLESKWWIHPPRRANTVVNSALLPC